MPKFENTWNWSNIIALSVVVVGGIAAFATVQADVKHLEQKVERVESLASKAQSDSESRIIHRLDQLQADIREIRAAQLRKGKE